MLFGTAAFLSNFIFHELSVKSFLEWVTRVAATASKEIMESMEASASRRKYVLKISQFLASENLVLLKLGTENIGQVLGESSAAQMYAMKNGRTRKLFLHFLRKELSSHSAQRCAALAVGA